MDFTGAENAMESQWIPMHSTGAENPMEFLGIPPPTVPREERPRAFKSESHMVATM